MRVIATLTTTRKSLKRSCKGGDHGKTKDTRLCHRDPGGHRLYGCSGIEHRRDVPARKGSGGQAEAPYKDSRMPGHRKAADRRRRLRYRGRSDRAGTLHGRGGDRRHPHRPSVLRRSQTGYPAAASRQTGAEGHRDGGHDGAGRSDFPVGDLPRQDDPYTP